MARNFQQAGDVMTITAGANLTSGQVVRVSNCVCVALMDIANGATGQVAREGVFVVPKVSSAVIAQGQSLLWDASAAAFDVGTATPATGDVSGPSFHAFEAAGNGVTSLAVYFTGAPGTVA
jgi:predicted RecA/RadA family phage recombinase